MAGRKLRAILNSSALLGAAALLSATLPAAAQTAASTLEITPVPSTPIEGSFTLAAVGDIIYLRPMLTTMEQTAPEMLRLLREADVTYGNFETSVFDLATFKGAPQAESGGTWMLGHPATVPDIANMGFDIVSTANNHATDWGAEGLIETLNLLDAAKIIRAGTGRTMQEARAPGYLDARQGRIGLVSSTSTFTRMTPAADPLGMVPGRPGANVIRTQKVGLVSESDLAVLRRLSGANDGAVVRIDGTTYRASPTAGNTITLAYEANARDEQANLRAIRQAKQNGNFVIYSFHNHEPGNWSQHPPAFAINFARRAIDEGADAFIAHGPHQLRGIEIYNGKPIFYSLGNFAMMNNSLDDVPADMYDQFGVTPGNVTTPELLQARNRATFSDPNLYESVVAQTRYQNGQLAEIRLYPIDLGVTRTGADRGVPRMANTEIGRRILERLARLSEPLGTRITIERGVGIIRVGN